MIKSTVDIASGPYKYKLVGDWIQVIHLLRKIVTFFSSNGVSVFWNFILKTGCDLLTVRMKTQMPDWNTAKASVTWLTAALPVATYWVGWWEAPGLKQPLWDQVTSLPWTEETQSCPLVPPSSSFPTTDQNACCFTPLACQRVTKRGREKMRERRRSNLQLSWWLWGTQLSPPISTCPHPPPHSRNPGAVSKLRVILWAGRGYFVT